MVKKKESPSSRISPKKEYTEIQLGDTNDDDDDDHAIDNDKWAMFILMKMTKTALMTMMTMSKFHNKQHVCRCSSRSILK